MAGRILIADSLSTNRMLVQAHLDPAGYRMLRAASRDEALAQAQDHRPDLVVISDSLGWDPALELCQTLTRRGGQTAPAVLMIARDLWPDRRMAALAAGADAVLETMPAAPVLQAWVRNLMRRRSGEQDLMRDQAAATALGFAEPAQAGFTGPGRIALIAPSAAEGITWRAGLAPLMRDRIEVLRPSEALAQLGHMRGADAIVMADTGYGPKDGMQLFSELKSRSETRDAAILMLQSTDDPARAVLALDMGVHDLVETGFSGPEMAVRLRRALARKAQRDTYQATLRDGLRLASIDDLTGLCNRRCGLTKLNRLVRAARGTSPGFAVLMLDLDRFKTINDRFGHAAGDAVLAEVAARMNAEVRREDCLSRWGGEEFMVTLDRCDLATAQRSAERLRRAVSDRPITLPGGAGQITVTLSVGVSIATGAAFETADSLIAAADRALYAAKARGRNQVTVTGADA